MTDGKSLFSKEVTWKKIRAWPEYREKRVCQVRKQHVWQHTGMMKYGLSWKAAELYMVGMASEEISGGWTS